MNLLELAIIQLIREEPFYAALVLQMDRVLDPSMRALASVRVRGGRIELRWSPEGTKDLSVEQAMGLLEHECLHVVMRHFTRAEGRGDIVQLGKQVHSLWNIACDVAINQLIRHPLPPNGLFPSQFKLPERLSAEAYYDALHGTLDLVTLSLAWDGEGEPGLIDDHDLWDELLDSDLVDEAVRQAIEQAKEQSRGRLPGGLEQAILAALDRPSLPWPSILQRYIGLAARSSWRSTWKRPSRRFGAEQKGKVAEHSLRLVVALDTSGSLDRPQLAAFLGETHRIAQSQRTSITVIECDAAVQRCYPLGRTPPKRVKGRGGTDFRPVFTHVEQEHPDTDVIVYLTDLHGKFPDTPPGPAVIWVRTAESRVREVPFGRLVLMGGNT